MSSEVAELLLGAHEARPTHWVLAVGDFFKVGNRRYRITQVTDEGPNGGAIYGVLLDRGCGCACSVTQPKLNWSATSADDLRSHNTAELVRMPELIMELCRIEGVRTAGGTQVELVGDVAPAGSNLSELYPRELYVGEDRLYVVIGISTDLRRPFRVEIWDARGRITPSKSLVPNRAASFDEVVSLVRVFAAGFLAGRVISPP